METATTQKSSTEALQQEKSRRLRTPFWRTFRQDWEVFARNKMAVAGLIVILVFAILAIAHPILRATIWQSDIYSPITGFDIDAAPHPSPPSLTHLLGTDGMGRDVLSMLLAATTPSFIVGVTAAAITAMVGTSVGVLSAYYRGPIDTVFTHISDAVILVPAPLFMVIVGIRFNDLGPAPLGAIYGILAGAGGAAVVMRSHALKVISQPFVSAARVAGGGNWHIMFKHVLPHMWPMTALYMMLAVTNAVIADAFISFGGFSRTYLNWGTMIYSSLVYAEYLTTGFDWHVLLPPGLALSLFAAAFYFVSRGLHKVADPRLRAR